VIACRLTARVRHIKMIAVCIAYRICASTTMLREIRGVQEHHVPLSGGNSPPAWMKLRKDDGARLNAPSDSVVILDISDRWETSREDMRSGPMWDRKRGFNGAEGRSLRLEQQGKRKPLSHNREDMTKVLAFWARWISQKVRRVSYYIPYAVHLDHDIPTSSKRRQHLLHPRPRIVESLLQETPDVLYHAICHQAPRRSCNCEQQSSMATVAHDRWIAGSGWAGLHGVT